MNFVFEYLVNLSYIKCLGTNDNQRLAWKGLVELHIKSL